MTGAKLALLAVAGFVGGAINAAAGGGSLITYPALLFVGLSPLAANVTNAVGLTPGYLGGVLGQRSSEALPEASLRRLVTTATAGALAGVALLLLAPERLFGVVAPVLVLAATVLLLIQPGLLKALRAKGYRGSSPRAVLVAAFCGGVYGAYFGAALGVVLLAVFAVASTASWPLANAVKTWLSLAINLIAAVLFLALAPVHVVPALVLAVGGLLGGYFGGGITRRVPVPVLRIFTAIIGAVAFIQLVQASGGK